MRNILLLLVAITLVGCALFPSAQRNDGIPRTFFTYQENSEKLMVMSQQFERMKKIPFEFRFTTKPYNAKKQEFYAAQIAGFTTSKAFKAVEVGMHVNDVEFLADGTGMATDTTGYYSEFNLNVPAHHYVFYDPKSSERTNLLETHKKHVKVSFPITHFNDNGMVYPLDQYPGKIVYFVIFMDYNLNKIIDNGELRKLEVEFYKR